MQPEPVTIELQPNEKYRAVVYGDIEREDPIESEADYREQHPAPDVADDFVEMMDMAEAPDDVVDDPDELTTLSWDDISPASDPDLLTTIATYFDGMEPTDASDCLAAKCRLLPVEQYVNAQIAARLE